MARSSENTPELSARSFKRSPKEIREALRALRQTAKAELSPEMPSALRPLKEVSRPRRQAA